MAIAVDVVLYAGSTGEGTHRLDIPRFPPLGVYHVTAVGVRDIDIAGARFIELRSRPGSDPVEFLTQLDALSATASESDTASIRLNSGESKMFGLGDSQNSTAIEIDFRAATEARFRNLEGEYETVAASQTGQVLGATGGAGDTIERVIVIPATTSPGAIALLDGATSITIFTGGATSVSNLQPFSIPLGLKSVSGAWSLTTGANVSAIAVGDFLT